MTDQRIPFQIKMHHKYDFRDWVRDQFPELGRYSHSGEFYSALEERFDEVHDAVMQVFDIIMTRSVPVLQDYYRQDLHNLREAYEQHDTQNYAKHLNAFLGAIGVE